MEKNILNMSLFATLLITVGGIKSAVPQQPDREPALNKSVMRVSLLTLALNEQPRPKEFSPRRQGGEELVFTPADDEAYQHFKTWARAEYQAIKRAVKSPKTS